MFKSLNRRLGHACVLSGSYPEKLYDYIANVAHVCCVTVSVQSSGEALLSITLSFLILLYLLWTGFSFQMILNSAIITPQINSYQTTSTITQLRLDQDISLMFRLKDLWGCIQWDFFFSKDALNWLKLTVKMYDVTKDLYFKQMLFFWIKNHQQQISILEWFLKIMWHWRLK